MACGVCRDEEGENCLKKKENQALSLIVLGFVIIFISLFSPTWRYDDHGTKELEANGLGTDIGGFNGFDNRHYGVLQVHGDAPQMWMSLESNVCQTGRPLSAFEDIFSVGDSDFGYTDHMNTRCTQYSVLATTSMVTLGMGMISFCIGMVALLMASMGDRNRLGGLIHCFLVLAALLTLIMNIVWAVVSDRAFKKLGESAYFPYPSLSWGWYLHLFGSLFALLGSIWFGFLILPKVREARNERHGNALKEWRMAIGPASGAYQSPPWRGEPQQVNAYAGANYYAEYDQAFGLGAGTAVSGQGGAPAFGLGAGNTASGTGYVGGSGFGLSSANPYVGHAGFNGDGGGGAGFGLNPANGGAGPGVQDVGGQQASNYWPTAPPPDSGTILKATIGTASPEPTSYGHAAQSANGACVVASAAYEYEAHYEYNMGYNGAAPQAASPPIKPNGMLPVRDSGPYMPELQAREMKIRDTE